MKRPDVVVRLRKGQRDLAVAQVRDREDELRRLEEAHARLEEALRAEFQASALGGGNLSPRRLELLDGARRAARAAAIRGREALSAARAAARESEVSLKQVEKLKEKEIEERREQGRRLEQRASDDFIRPGKAMGLLLLVALLGAGACGKKAAPAEKKRLSVVKKASKEAKDKASKEAQKEASKEAKDKASKEAQDKAKDGVLVGTSRDAAKTTTRDEAEGRLLAKLRERSERLRDRERKIAERQRELVEIEARVRQMVDQLGRIQTRLEQGLRSAATQPTKTVASKKTKRSPSSQATAVARHGPGDPQKDLAKAATPTPPKRGDRAPTGAAPTFAKGPLASVVGRMPDKSAAMVLSQMDPREAARVLLALPRPKAAKILGRLSEESSGAVGDAMAALQWPPKVKDVPKKTSGKRKGRRKKRGTKGRRAARGSKGATMRRDGRARDRRLKGGPDLARRRRRGGGRFRGALLAKGGE